MLFLYIRIEAARSAAPQPPPFLRCTCGCLFTDMRRPVLQNHSGREGEPNRTNSEVQFKPHKIHKYSNRIKYLMYIYIYKYRDGPRGVIWNLVVRASFFNVFFTINSKSHVFDMIFSASILTFSCGSNGMGPNILFSAICEVRGGFDFPKGVFSRNKRICS